MVTSFTSSFIELLVRLSLVTFCADITSIDAEGAILSVAGEIDGCLQGRWFPLLESDGNPFLY